MFANNGTATANANDRTEQTLAAYYPDKATLMVEVKFTLLLLHRNYSGFIESFLKTLNQVAGKPYSKLEHEWA